ncbi:hypothetical protein PROP_03135 [Propionicimonas sp. T2.31MG-18]|uniref:hypothetical protein n=1 Tax=Propionicimonas sp. T2.31MG-18 TaxID=3157620 RepID=UPI0035E9C5D9
MGERDDLYRRVARGMRELAGHVDDLGRGSESFVRLFDDALAIVCANESHAPDVVLVGTIYPSAPSMIGSTTLIGNTPAATLREALKAPGRTRARYRLECPRCGLTVEFRQEKMPIVQRIVDLGVSRLDISSLEGYIRK